VAIELIDTPASSEVTCPSCGSLVSSADATFLNPEALDQPRAESPLAHSGRRAGGEGHLAPGAEPAATPDEKRFGRFRLLKPLGKGSFGEVWLADDPKLQRQVALKFPRAGKQKNFHWEAQAAAKLRHSNIVTVFEVGEETYNGQPNWPYIASEYIPSQDLAKVLKPDPKEPSQPLPPKCAAEICRKVAAALHTAHQAGVVHCDLKPLNILIDEHGEPHVMDFGLARRDAEPGFTLTTQGPGGGTPGYSSPEQWQGKDIDCRTDVWALGIILFELLTGERPFRAERDLKLLRDQILHDDPPPPSKLNSQVPADLDTLCLKCLAKDPTRRFPTAATLAEELRRFLHGEPIHSRPIPQWERAKKWCQRNPVVASLSAAVIVVLLTGTAVSSFFWLQSESRNRDLVKETMRANAKTDEARLNLYDARMNLLQRNWEASNIGLVLDLLDKTKPQPDAEDLRDFEWFYWDRLCHSSYMELKGHTGQILSVAVSPDGTRLASASKDHTVKIWDASNGAELLTLKGHNDAVTNVTFSADGRRMASAGGDETIRVWDTTTGAESFKLARPRVTSAVFSPDGKLLASAGWDMTVKLHDAMSGIELRELKGHSNTVTRVAFSPDGKRLASASMDKTVKVWDATSGVELRTLKGHTDFINSVAFSPDGKRLASAGFMPYPIQPGHIKVWDATSGLELLTIRGHDHAVMGVAFSPDGKRLASASADRTVKVWDATSGRESHTLKGHIDYVTSVVYSPDGKRLVSASEDQTIRVWDATHGMESRTLNGPSDAIWSVAITSDGDRVGSASLDGTVSIWDTRSGAVSRSLNGHANTVLSVTFDAEGKRMASAGSDGTVKVWETTSGGELHTLKGHTDGVYCVAFSPDGKKLASASIDKTVKVWDATNGTETLTLTGHADMVTSVAFSPDGKRLASGSYDQAVKVWDATGGAESLTLKGHTRAVTSVAFSPDGKRLATASYDQTVKVWDAICGAEAMTLRGHTSAVRSVTFSPGGKRLASASVDGTARVWNAISGAESLVLKGHSDFVTSVAFSADGQRLASGSNDKTVKLWDAYPWTPKLRAEREALSLIHWLRDQDKPQSEWLDAIAADQSLTEPVRQRALQFAREWK
jgi:WD40 repeat protein